MTFTFLAAHGHVSGAHNFFADLRRGRDVGLAVALMERRQRFVLSVATFWRELSAFSREVGLDLVGLINLT